MNPYWNVFLGLILGFGALVIAPIKLLAPANPWHRHGGRLLIPAGIIMTIAMIFRTHAYQVPLSMWARGHAVIGAIAVLLFVAKFMASRRWVIPPKHMRTLGWGLTIVFPLASFGMILPYIYSSWPTITTFEVTKDPSQNSFDRMCLRCHDRETAVEGLYKRSTARWIEIVEPMAWAGGYGREETRGALAALLAEGPPLNTLPTGVSDTRPRPSNIGLPPGAVASASPIVDPLDRCCVKCHDKQRTLSARKTPEKWRGTVARMRKYASEQFEAETPFTDASTEECIAWLVAHQSTESSLSVATQTAP